MFRPTFFLFTVAALMSCGVAQGTTLYNSFASTNLISSYSLIFDPTTAHTTPLAGIYTSETKTTMLGGVFGDLNLTRADIGHSQVSTTGSPGFAEFVAALTDGQNNYLFIPWRPHGTVGDTEAHRFSGVSLNGVDLRGYNIEKVTYSILTWNFISPGRDLNHNGIWTDEYYSYYFSIEGSLAPEPGGIVLAACGFGGVFALGRRKRA